MKADPTQTALAALDEIPLHTAEGRKQIAKALAARSNRVAAKAARIAGKSQWPELKPDLVTAFDRFLAHGAEIDKGCVAASAIARALFKLDYDEPDLFLKGMQHVQMEPVFGGSVDTAAELRGLSAMGLAGTRFPHKLRAFVDLLVDREWQARAGAVKAITAEGSETAALLLRLKTFTGDKEPEVLAECFTGLLAIDVSEAILIVSSFARHGDAAIAEAAILALGTSRRSESVTFLTELFPEVADPQTKRCLLLALSSARTEAAIAFLISVITDADPETSAMALSALEIHRDEPLRARIGHALRARQVKPA